MKRFFRPHRGGLAESLAEKIEVENLSHITRAINKIYESFYIQVDKISICKDVVHDNRIGDEWKDTYYVIVDFDNAEFKNICVGMCNFYEDI